MSKPVPDQKPAPPQPPIVEISAPRGLVPLNLREVWEFRELVFFMFWRDLKGRYRQMAFGPLWMIVSPIFNMVVYTILFGTIAKLPADGVPYHLFNYAGLLPWTFFVSAFGVAQNSLLGYRDLISKVYFPRLIIPLVGILSSLTDLFISFLILVGLCLHAGYLPTIYYLFVPLFMAMASITGLAVGLWVASWIVHFRDIGVITSYVIRVWMYATPIVYSISLVPARWRTLYFLNPMVGIVEGFRWAVLRVGTPPGPLLWGTFALVILLLVSGAYYFRKTERSIVDIA
jgi:lipopolysaccharide transport system permease protein